MRSAFLAHAGPLFTWTLAGQLIGLLSAPVVARLYGPEAYGIAAMILTTSATIAIISSGRFEQAIVVANSEEDAAALQILCRNIITIVGIVVLLVCTALYIYPPESVAELFGVDLYLLFGIPIIAVLNGFAVVRRRVLNRRKSYSQIGIAAFSNGIAVPISRIISALIAQGNALLLVISGMFGWSIEVFQLRSRNTDFQPSRLSQTKASLRDVARRYNDFPIFSLPEGLMSNVSIQLPIYTFGFIYSPAVTGLYAMAIRVVRLPVFALSTAVSQVLLRQFEEHRQSGGRLAIPMVRSTVGLLLVSTAIGLPIMVFGEAIFRIIMGESWATAGLYAAILVPWIVSGVAIIPSRLSFVIIRRQGIWLFAQVGLFILRILIMVAAVAFQLDVLTTLWFFSLTNAGYNALTFFGALFLLVRNDAKGDIQFDTDSVV